MIVFSRHVIRTILSRPGGVTHGLYLVVSGAGDEKKERSRAPVSCTSRVFARARLFQIVRPSGQTSFEKCLFVASAEDKPAR